MTTKTSTAHEPLNESDRGVIYGAMGGLLFLGLAIGYRAAITDWSAVVHSWMPFCS